MWDSKRVCSKLPCFDLRSERVPVWAALRLSCRETSMKILRCSEISELSSLRRSQDAARLWCFASVVAVACRLLACSRAAPPQAAREARPQTVVAAPAPPVHSGAAGADHGSFASAGDSIPEALRVPCASVTNLVRAVVSAAPSITRITELAGPRPITFEYIYAKARAAGCEFTSPCTACLGAFSY